MKTKVKTEVQFILQSLNNRHLIEKRLKELATDNHWKLITKTSKAA